MRILLSAFLILFAGTPLLFSQENETCFSCHGQKDTDVPFVRHEDFQKSVHKDLSCIACHTNAAEVPHTGLGQASPIHRMNIPQTCGVCHEDVLKTYRTSVHGKAWGRGVKEAAVCTDCHGEHTIRAVKDPASTVWGGAVTKTCAQCHESQKIQMKFGLPQDRLKTFHESYHGLAGRMGDITVANCASCHGWHNILPFSDPESSIHPQNLANTCGKCHEGVKTTLTQTKIHKDVKTESFYLVQWARIFYLLVIPLFIGSMFLHNLFDYVRKIAEPKSSVISDAQLTQIRLNSNERIQHGILILGFIILAYSGFALKYPEAWWSYPLKALGGEGLRKACHRWTALIYSLLAVYHAGYMLLTRRGRLLIRRKLFPKIQDFSDAWDLTLYNIGFKPSKSKLRYPSYIERLEYWALVWGSAIMIVTGTILVFNNWTLQHLPFWASDLATTIHFYEAVLACLAVLVWHFYWAILDPEIYPMNLSWLIGTLKKK